MIIFFYKSLSGHLLLGTFLGIKTFTNLGVESFTGSHLASAEAVASSRADLASIDCVTWCLLKHHKPHLASRLKVIGQTHSCLCLPYVMDSEATEEDVTFVREAICSVMLSSGDSSAR